MVKVGGGDRGAQYHAPGFEFASLVKSEPAVLASMPVWNSLQSGIRSCS